MNPARGRILEALFGWEIVRRVAGLSARALRMLLGIGRTATPHAPSHQSDRVADQDIEPDTLARRRWGTFLVTGALVAAVAAGVGYLFLYWSYDKIHWNPANTRMLGITLALCFAAIGVGFVLHAHWLMEHKEAIEPREELSSPPEEREEAFESYTIARHEVHRRALLVGLGAAGVSLCGAIFLSMMRSLAPRPNPPLFTRVWTRGQRLMTQEGQPITADALTPGSTTIVFPEASIGDVKAQTVLIRIDPHLFDMPPARVTWTPRGYVAYSRVCTHAGCPVGLFQATNNLLLCPCHQSTFDVLRAGQPTAGPASRPLAQLPLYIDEDGVLRAGGGFSEPPGPGFWWMYA